MHVQHFLDYVVWNFHSNRLMFQRVVQENKNGCLFGTQFTVCNARSQKQHACLASSFKFCLNSLSITAGTLNTVGLSYRIISHTVKHCKSTPLWRHSPTPPAIFSSTACWLDNSTHTCPMAYCYHSTVTFMKMMKRRPTRATKKIDWGL